MAWIIFSSPTVFKLIFYSKPVAASTVALIKGSGGVGESHRYVRSQGIKLVDSKMAA